ncbi:MAG: hypothetical protein ABR962_05525 [Candidatus Bathyarchaeia archaeon]|jgi:hypothetical protein
MKLYVLVGIIATTAVASGFGLMVLSPPSFSVKITSSPSGSGFIAVDGNAVVTPCDFSWQSGSKHNITASIRASASGVQYAYSSWSDGGVQSHTITINGTSDYNATFVTVMPLTYDYVPGEQMTYNMSLYETDTAASWAGLNLNETGNMTIDVVSFDGENYTIKETRALSSSSAMGFPTTSTTSDTFQVNKTGYLLSINGGSAFVQKLSSWLGNFISAFEKNETETGNTWQIPLSGLYPTSNSTFVFDGNLTETFGYIQNLTVPAGTYRVFSVDVSGNNLTMVANYPPLNTSISQNITTSGREYLEYGTNRMIEMSMQMSISILQNGQTSEQGISEQIELVKYVGH